MQQPRLACLSLCIALGKPERDPTSKGSQSKAASDLLFAIELQVQASFCRTASEFGLRNGG